MPPNSQQRPIFVYLRSKDDPKSCTTAGAKLTNEYTHRTNKNNPCIVSVTPPQLCTFFRKRTISHVDIFYSPRRDETIPPKFHLIPRKFHFISTWIFFILYVEIWEFPRGDLLSLQHLKIKLALRVDKMTLASRRLGYALKALPLRHKVIT